MPVNIHLPETFHFLVWLKWPPKREEKGKEAYRPSL
jgi:hypothetical protein